MEQRHQQHVWVPHFMADTLLSTCVSSHFILAFTLGGKYLLFFITVVGNIVDNHEVETSLKSINSVLETSTSQRQEHILSTTNYILLVVLSIWPVHD